MKLNEGNVISYSIWRERGGIIYLWFLDIKALINAQLGYKNDQVTKEQYLNNQ